MVDRVAEANGLKKANVIHPGQNLQVPTREKSESLSSKDLQPGEEQTSQVDISEESSDGAVENIGRRVHEYIFGAWDTVTGWFGGGRRRGDGKVRGP